MILFYNLSRDVAGGVANTLSSVLTVSGAPALAATVLFLGAHFDRASYNRDVT